MTFLFFSFLFVLRGGVFELSFGFPRAVRGNGMGWRAREGEGAARGRREGGREGKRGGN